MTRATYPSAPAVVALRWIAFASCWAAAVLPSQAQTSPLREPSQETSAASHAPAVGTKPAARRAVSPETAALINASVPKFSPTKSPEPTPIEKQPDLRELDKPKNQIIRLPSYIVVEPKAPVFKERESLTPTGRLELALKRRPGMKFGNFWMFNNYGFALAMLEEDYRLERKAEMIEFAGLYHYSRTPEETKALKREVEEAYMRQADFGWQGGGPK